MCIYDREKYKFRNKWLYLKKNKQTKTTISFRLNPKLLTVLLTLINFLWIYKVITRNSFQNVFNQNYLRHDAFFFRNSWALLQQSNINRLHLPLSQQGFQQQQVFHSRQAFGNRWSDMSSNIVVKKAFCMIELWQNKACFCWTTVVQSKYQKTSAKQTI